MNKCLATLFILTLLTATTLAGVALSLFLAAPAGATELTVKNSPGGLIDKFTARIEASEARGDRVELRGEFCDSACTFWLTHSNVCVDRSTQFGFHGPSNFFATLIQVQIIPISHWMGAEERTRWVNYMANYYRRNGDPRLGDWFIRSGAYEKFGMAVTRLSGQELHDHFGLELCADLPPARTVVGER